MKRLLIYILVLINTCFIIQINYCSQRMKPAIKSIVNNEVDKSTEPTQRQILYGTHKILTANITDNDETIRQDLQRAAEYIKRHPSLLSQEELDDIEYLKNRTKYEKPNNWLYTKKTLDFKLPKSHYSESDLRKIAELNVKLKNAPYKSKEDCERQDAAIMALLTKYAQICPDNPALEPYRQKIQIMTMPPAEPSPEEKIAAEKKQFKVLQELKLNHLLDLIKKGNMTKAKQIVANDPDIVDLINENGLTPLMNSVMAQNYKLIQELLSLGANKNIKNLHNQTALDIAKEIERNSNTKEMVRILTESTPSKVKQTGRLKRQKVKSSSIRPSSILPAIDIPSKETKEEIELNENRSSSFKKLIHLINNDNINMVKKLLAMQPDLINFIDESGLTPLMEAIYTENFEMVKTLIDLGADITQVGINNETALDIANKLEKNLPVKTMTNFLKAKKLKLTYKPNLKNLISFIDNENINTVKRLINTAPDLVNEIDENGLTPLMHAVFTENSEMVKTLLELKANQSIKDKNGNTALDMAKKVEKNSSEKPMTNILKPKFSFNPTAKTFTLQKNRG